MKVEQIRIENVFGIRHLEFSPDGVAIVRGDNAAGKSSVIRAILLLLGGGHDPEALRKDSDKGEVRFVLDDGTEVYARLTEANTYYRVEGREDVTARQLMDKLQDEISVNPIRILRADPGERGQIVLESMPMNLDEGELEQALSPLKGTKYYGFYATDLDTSDHALEVLGDKSSGLISEIYDTRREMSGSIRTKKGAVEDLESSVEHHDDPDELREQRDELTEKVKDLQDDKEREMSEVNSWEKKEIEKVRAEARKRRRKVRNDHDSLIQDVESKRDRISERLRQAEKAQDTKDRLEQRRAELSTLQAQRENLTEAIENLRNLRTSYTEVLPGGVELAEDGELVQDGIRFENWNWQKRVQYALDIAERRAGPLKIIPFDGIDQIVGEQRDQLLDLARESDAQFILTEAVSGKPLTIDHA